MCCQIHPATLWEKVLVRGLTPLEYLTFKPAWTYEMLFHADATRDDSKLEFWVRHFPRNRNRRARKGWMQQFFHWVEFGR